MSTSSDANSRIRVAGKFLRVGEENFYVKGFAYGPFALNSTGDFLPEREQMRKDFSQIRNLGANALRLYSVPSRGVLDDAQERELRLLIDIPWEKHRCFFEDWSAVQAARESVTSAAQLLGDHPAVMAISIVNEIPNDVVRFYGHQRVGRFLSELSDLVKQLDPELLTTFANYPTTEFLQPGGFDFCCYNIYLHDPEQLGAYLGRLQHIAGDTPLVLGELGLDSIREGESAQASLLAEHVRVVFRHGLAGSFVFSFTDDWFTGGETVTDWGFGVTRADREEKPAASALKAAWDQAPFSVHNGLPHVSVVVCSYNGGKTLRACLESLQRINYPDVEVILVDDGSEDDTPQIATEFPEVVYVRQANAGLSVARNVGAERATGEIVAYTDDDCVAGEDWLRCLVQAMRDQHVEVIGGSNIAPPTDRWSAKCVAASPGNPSHVMLDDNRAEHIPGCNMAFRRETLLGLGGFDPVFRQAGDDVDMCWRVLDAGHSIGYAPGAFVWHHRRATVNAYIRQQVGYGRAEAVLHFKHPHRFGLWGRCSWSGRIYGSGVAGLPLIPERIYYGPFGLAPFQLVYRHNHFGMWACVTWLEWHLIALLLIALSWLFWPLALFGGAMWCATGAVMIRAGAAAELPKDGPWWCRPLVAVLHLLQPCVREWYRLTYDLRMWRPRITDRYLNVPYAEKQISPKVWDLYWTDREGRGREVLLERLVDEARHIGWLGVFNNAWAAWDAKLVGDLWHTLHIHTASEGLAMGVRFTRARCVAKPTLVNRIFFAGVLICTIAALISQNIFALPIALGASGIALYQNISSRRRCLRAVMSLVVRAGQFAALTPVDPGSDGVSQVDPISTDESDCPLRDDSVAESMV